MLSVVLVACTRETRRDGWQVRTTSSPPSTFLDTPGLTQMTVSTYTPDDFGSTHQDRIVVFRDGKRVCEVGSSWRSGHEHHSSWGTTTIDLQTRSPLQFDVRTTASSKDLDDQWSCTRYELPDHGVCRTLFERTCTMRNCRSSYDVAYRQGTGRVLGTVMLNKEPLVGGLITIGDEGALADGGGAFEATVAVGPQTVAVVRESVVYGSKGSITVQPDQDAVVSIVIDCSCCASQH